MQRIEWIDQVKGIGILFVIIGHHLIDAPDVTNWINTFHMPMFFILSGILFSNKSNIKFHFEDELKNRAKKLIYPYFTFSCIVLIWYVVWYEIVLKNIAPTESLSEVVLKTITTYGYHALWFLPSMFLATEIYFFYRNNSNRYIACFTSVVIGCIFAKLSEINGFNVFVIYIIQYISRVSIALSFIIIGEIFHCLLDKISVKKEWFILFISAIISLFFSNSTGIV